jgi:cytidine deaminase
MAAGGVFTLAKVARQLLFQGRKFRLRMKDINRNELDPTVLAALEAVETALNNSHCPHSGLSVAAGLMMDQGGVVLGVNYESASYGLTLCAERTAIAKAQTEGTALNTKALVLAVRSGGDTQPAAPLTPCGACRQWLSELSNRLGHDFPVYSFWQGGTIGRLGSARELLPEAFESF